MAKKRYDPLWELVDERVALQGQEPDGDAQCPHCHVQVHLGESLSAGARVACGLCGGGSVVFAENGISVLQPVTQEKLPA